ncbi:elongation factor P maturation arginine rhamnosyltransferase EarP [Comamonas composti]|uniref:elongation factor P maturation arginine rhamnosyltransferase EarP n=1 Tax=Comamonas composti TaxID=408558 RepID=UPI00047D498D|nr:elongation factor P maturation arginine rhamnosyltransferase EarP [Comamonas composti]
MTAFSPLPATTAAAPPAPGPSRTLIWDIFCQVIDNFGDIGVCWRTACDLAAHGQQVRLWVDDASALDWMAPPPHPRGLSLHGWPVSRELLPAMVGDVIVEAFGCEIPAPFVSAIARASTERTALGAASSPVWINLEYLSAEDYVERCHGLPSPLMSGPAAGLTRWFFYPGFTGATGGLLREEDLPARQAAFDPAAWRARHGIAPQDCAISLFCYEPPALTHWLAQLQASPPAPPGASTHLLLTPGRARSAVAAARSPDHAAVSMHELAACSQAEFDHMLWACDLNLVRGEDSLVRALWAGQPFVWHIYPQHDNAHHAKLDAFLDWLDAPACLRAFHHAWNGMRAATDLPPITAERLAEWRQCVQSARSRLLQLPPLVEQLQAFVAEKS